ncbi:unnamed protein product [Ectocarpus sp. CCAP 1310/34]|nr:unnamed protein product [Ectocarpus sp. CCAP 1310/34]
MLIHKLDYEFDRAILQARRTWKDTSQGVEKTLGRDTFPQPGKKLGKKVPKKDREDAKLTNATARVQHMERSREMVSVFNSIVYAHDKQLKGAVLTLTKQQMDRIAVSLLNRIVGEKDTLLKDAIQGMERKDKALLTSKNNDFLKFVMGLSRRVKADVQRAIQVKDYELGKMVAMMDEEELRALVDFGPTGKEDINLWKRDRRKRSWRRLSAFGMVRNDPSLYRQWAQQRYQRLASQAEVTNTDRMLGTTCATDAARRPPWSTDLHYSHRCRAQQQQPGIKQQQQRQQRASIADLPVSDESSIATGLGRLKCVHTAPSSRHPARAVAKNRPASAPSGAVERVSPRQDQRETARTPSLARLARVFYQSTVASTASTLGECSSRQQPSSIEYLSGEIPDPAESVCFQVSSQPEAHEGEASKDDSHAQTTTSVVHGERNGDTIRSSALDGVEKRMESVRLLWADKVEHAVP